MVEIPVDADVNYTDGTLFTSDFGDDSQILDAYLNDDDLLLPETDYNPDLIGFDMSEMTLEDSAMLPAVQTEWLLEDDTETEFERKWNEHWKKNQQYITIREWYRRYPTDFDPIMVIPKYMRLQDTTENCIKIDNDFLVMKTIEVVAKNVTEDEKLVEVPTQRRKVSMASGHS